MINYEIEMVEQKNNSFVPLQKNGKKVINKIQNKFKFVFEFI